MIYERNFELKIDEWYKSNSNNTSLIVTGARQVGKTEGIKNWAKVRNYRMLEIDLSKSSKWIDDIVKVDSYETLVSLLCNIKGFKEDDIDVIFLDEIQVHPDILYLCRFFRNQRIKLICSGSLLGTKLSSSSFRTDVGSKTYLRVFPLSFEEFLKWTGNEKYLSMIDKSFNNLEQIHSGFHQELNNLLYQFLIIGGMPNVVANYIEDGQVLTERVNNLKEGIYKDYLNDNQESFYGYDENKKNTIKTIDLIFSKIDQFLIQPENKRFVIDSINKNFRYKNIEVPLHIIKNANIAIPSNKIQFPCYPLEHHKVDEQFKLYYSDVGILTYKLKINNDMLQSYKAENTNSNIWGGIIENYIAQELQSDNLYYWKDRVNGRDYQIDFLFESKKDGSIIPCEVKSKSGTHKNSKSLQEYVNKFNPKEIICLGLNNFSKNENKIYIPLYAAYKLKEIIN